VTDEYSRRYPNVRYCFEPRQGIAYARNHGVEEARGEYVALCDDDCELPPQWLATAKDVIDTIKPGVFGGGFFAIYDGPKPHWYKDSYGSYHLGEMARILEKDFVFGGNSFYRRSLLLNLGGFDVTRGMIGKKLGYGEEIVPQLLIRSTMPDELIYYDPKLHVRHLVRSEKMHWRWIIRESFAKGYHAYRLFSMGRDPVVKRSVLWIQAAKTLLGLLWDATVGVAKRDHVQYPYFQNYFFEHTAEYLKKLGRLYARHEWQSSNRQRHGAGGNLEAPLSRINEAAASGTPVHLGDRRQDADGSALSSARKDQRFVAAPSHGSHQARVRK
jgi:glycosyltransferase involved in cell wall biosynthesis